MTRAQNTKAREQAFAKATALVEELNSLSGDELQAKQTEVDAQFAIVDDCDARETNFARVQSLKSKEQERKEFTQRVVQNGGDQKFRQEIKVATDDGDVVELSHSDKTEQGQLWARFHRGEKLSDSEQVAMRRRGKYDVAFSQWLRDGDNQHFAVVTGATVSTQGSSQLLPKVFFNEVVHKMQDWGPFPGIARTITTENGNNMELVTADTTSRKSTVVAQGDSSDATARTYGRVDWPVHRMDAPDAVVTFESIQDLQFDVEGEVQRDMAESHGRGMNQYFTVGTGSNQPAGVYTTVAAVAARHTTSAKTVTGSGAYTEAQLSSEFLNEFLGVWDKIDPAYERGGNLSLLVSVPLRNRLRRMRTTTGAFLLEPNLNAAIPTNWMVHGAGVYTTPELTWANGGKAMVLGDFQRYYVRIVSDMRLTRLVEKYAESNAVGFHSSMRAGGVTADTSAFATMAIKS